MNAEEFAKWVLVHETAPVDTEGDSAIGDLAWRAMVAIVEELETHRPGDIEDVARETADGIKWAAFWLAAGVVLVAAIVRLT